MQIHIVTAFESGTAMVCNGLSEVYTLCGLAAIEMC